MAESSSHKSPSPEIKEKHVTLDKPKSLNPFLPVTQVDFTFDEITFTTKNEVALIYPSHPNQEYIMAVSDFISKCFLKEAFTRALTQYKEDLSEFWYTTKILDNSKVWVSTPTCEVRGEIGITTFRNALKAHYLPHSTMYVPPPSITTVDYAKIIWDDLIHKLNKKTREKIVPYLRFISLLLEHMATEYENEELTINPTQVYNVHNLTLKPNQPEEPPFTDHLKAICKKLGATTGLRSKRSLKHTSESKTEASKSQTGQSKIETQSSSAKDKSLSHPLPPTPVVGEMHKEAHQAASDSIAEADPRLSAPNDSIPPQQGMDEGTKNTSYEHIFAGFNPNVLIDKTKSIGDGLKTVHTESGASNELGADEISKKYQKKELDQAKVKVKAEAEAEAEVASMKAKPSYPDINQLTKLLIIFLKPELSKLLASHDFTSCLPTELKELPSKENLKTLDSLPGLLKTVTNTLNRFATLVENASAAITIGVPSVNKATASPAVGEKDADTNLKNKLVDLLGIDIITQYYNKKLLYERYCEKIKKRRQSSKIINCDVLTKKGPISLKVHREDGTTEVIENFKASDLQLAEWRKAVQACPNRKETGWKTIYELIKIRMKYLEQTEKELHIDFNRSLQEQDPLDELNDLANKKRKRSGDSTDHSRSSKKHKSSSST
uniref:Uncharacterized protein n=1 Tax=Tanacetum cinerariifolium TaxID=118510 RepID=A0A6L2JSM1_TANCI|nr:hypothetical protein [Tanacetum cinerariifolium]